MKIVATIRTLNEEHRIEKCCLSYGEFCDLILVADGGSGDNTVEIAKSMPKTLVRNYDVKVECKNGIWRNPDYLHLMFLWDWAIEEGADWIISQDCDQRPNKHLKQDARSIMERTEKDLLLVTQVFLWGKSRYFPMMSMPNNQGWQQGLWAWRANFGMRVIDKMPHFEFSMDGKKSFHVDEIGRHETLLPPYCFMHFGWETEQMALDHVEYYNKSGLIETMVSPLKFGGPLRGLEEWMVE